MTGIQAQPPRKERKDIRVGYLHNESLCWTFFQYHALMAAKALGVQFNDYPVHTAQEQMAVIAELIREPIDVLVIRPMESDDPELLDLARAAQARGLHLITVDGAIGGGLETCEVSSDNYGGQAAMMRHVAERLGGQGKVAYFHGNLEFDAGLLRARGLHDALQDYPGITLAYEALTDWGSTVSLREQAAVLARRALEAHPDLEAILTISDECAFGVHDVLQACGLSDQVLVTGFDALPEALIAITDGGMAASVLQPLDLLARQTLSDAIRMVEGDMPVPTRTILPTEIITRHNMAPVALRALRIFPDITRDLFRSRAEHQQTASFLEVVLDNVPIMLSVKDARKLAYVRSNKASDDWLGVPHDSQLGKTAHDLFAPEQAQAIEAAERDLLAAGAHISVEDHELIQPDGSTRYVHAKKIPLLDRKGQPAYLLAIAEDVTERKLAEASLARHAAQLEAANRALLENQRRLIEAEKMAALGSLVAGISHELNTPIGNGLMAASTLADHTRAITTQLEKGLTRSVLTNFLEDAAGMSGILTSSLHRAADLIASFKQIAIDQTSSRARQFSLATVVRETVITLSPTLKRTPFVVTQDIPEDLTLDSFPGPLEQVLMNLINNALVHGLAGRSRGVLLIAARALDAERIELIVQDDGEGIPAENLPRIFEPFFSTRFGLGGSGLGLSITHSIVTGLLGGSIEVISEPGFGACFRLTLPRVAPSLPSA